MTYRSSSGRNSGHRARNWPHSSHSALSAAFTHDGSVLFSRTTLKLNWILVQSQASPAGFRHRMEGVSRS